MARRDIAITNRPSKMLQEFGLLRAIWLHDLNNTDDMENNTSVIFSPTTAIFSGTLYKSFRSFLSLMTYEIIFNAVLDYRFRTFSLVILSINVHFNSSNFLRRFLQTSQLTDLLVPLVDYDFQSRARSLRFL